MELESRAKLAHEYAIRMIPDDTKGTLIYKIKLFHLVTGDSLRIEFRTKSLSEILTVKPTTAGYVEELPPRFLQSALVAID